MFEIIFLILIICLETETRYTVEILTIVSLLVSSFWEKMFVEYPHWYADSEINDNVQDTLDLHKEHFMFDYKLLLLFFLMVIFIIIFFNKRSYA